MLNSSACGERNQPLNSGKTGLPNSRSTATIQGPASTTTAAAAPNDVRKAPPRGNRQRKRSQGEHRIGVLERGGSTEQHAGQRRPAPGALLFVLFFAQQQEEPGQHRRHEQRIDEAAADRHPVHARSRPQGGREQRELRLSVRRQVRKEPAGRRGKEGRCSGCAPQPALSTPRRCASRWRPSGRTANSRPGSGSSARWRRKKSCSRRPASSWNGT